eukprot:Awhi_evm1s4868
MNYLHQLKKQQSLPMKPREHFKFYNLISSINSSAGLLFVLVLMAMVHIGVSAPINVGSPSSATFRNQLVAMVPNVGGTTLQWVQLTFPPNVSTVSDVQMTKPDLSNPKISKSLGTWSALDFSVYTTPIMLDKINATYSEDYIPQGTCKIGRNNSKLYCFARILESTPSSNTGCCADTMRVFDKATGEEYSVDLKSNVQKALKTDGLVGWDTGFPSHTFDLMEKNGRMYAVSVVRFNSTNVMNGSYTDAIVAVGLEDGWKGSVLATSEGRQSVVMYRDFGTFGDSDTVYKIQFAQVENIEFDKTMLNTTQNEQWHENGIESFETKAGVPLLAFTHRWMAEVVLISHPWLSSGSIEILQRFGTPGIFDKSGRQVGTHFFGVSAVEDGPFYSGLHNVYYTSYPDGRETLTCLVNQQGRQGNSAVYEFDINIVQKEQDYAVTDYFSTAYTQVKMSYHADAMGGGRPLGHGVYIAASGMSSNFFSPDGTHLSGGIEIASWSKSCNGDCKANKVVEPYAAWDYTLNTTIVAAFYDPF